MSAPLCPLGSRRLAAIATAMLLAGGTSLASPAGAAPTASPSKPAPSPTAEPTTAPAPTATETEEPLPTITLEPTFTEPADPQPLPPTGTASPTKTSTVSPTAGPGRPGDELTTSQRVVDTRDGEGTPVARGESVTFNISGIPGVQKDKRNVVSLNVTAAEAQEVGFFTVHEAGTNRPGTSNLNYAPGDTVANHVITTTNTAGDITVYGHGLAHLIVDVTAVHAESVGIRAAQDPVRALDTRQGSGPVPAMTSVSVEPGAMSLPLPGAPEKPDAWVLSVTAVDAKSDGFVTVHPGSTPRPVSSNLNYAQGQTIAGLTTVPASFDGSVLVYSHGETDLLVDVVGWVEAGATYTSISAARALDTRDMESAHGGFFGFYYEIDVNDAGLPEGETKSVLVNLTATESSADSGGFMTSFRSTAPRPGTSMLNFRKHQNIANSAFVPVSEDGTIRVFTNNFSHVIVDIQGYVKGPPAKDGAPMKLTEDSLGDMKFPLDGADIDRLYGTFGTPDKDQIDTRSTAQSRAAESIKKRDIFWQGVSFTSCRPIMVAAEDNKKVDALVAWTVYNDLLPATTEVDLPTFVAEPASAVTDKYPNVVRKDAPTREEGQEPGWYSLQLPDSQYHWIVDPTSDKVLGLSNYHACENP